MPVICINRSSLNTDFSFSFTHTFATRSTINVGKNLNVYSDPVWWITQYEDKVPRIIDAIAKRMVNENTNDSSQVVNLHVSRHKYRPTFLVDHTSCVNNNESTPNVVYNRPFIYNHDHKPIKIVYAISHDYFEFEPVIIQN